MDAYKTEHNVKVEGEEEEEEEEAQQPKQYLQLIEMYNELVPEGYFMIMEAVDSFITEYETASSNKLKVIASRVARGYKVYGCAEHEN